MVIMWVLSLLVSYPMPCSHVVWDGGNRCYDISNPKTTTIKREVQQSHRLTGLGNGFELTVGFLKLPVLSKNKI